MLNLDLVSFPEGAVVRPHSHGWARINLLYRGELLEYGTGDAGRLSVVKRSAPCVWALPAGSIHSLRIVREAHFAALQIRSGAAPVPRLGLAPALLVALMVQAANGCEYGADDIERILNSEVQVRLPDCFFNELEASAAGGDSQAQLELGIIQLEGMDRREAVSPSMGLYWLRRSIAAGHPSAQSIFDSYQSDYSC